MDKRNITEIEKCRATLPSIHRQINFNAICSRVLMETLRNILVVAWVFTLYNVRTSVKRRKQNQCEKTLPLLLLCPKKWIAIFCFMKLQSICVCALVCGVRKTGKRQQNYVENTRQKNIASFTCIQFHTYYMY